MTDYLSLFWNEETSQDKQWIFGKRLFQIHWFPEFSIPAKLLSGFSDKSITLNFTPKSHFGYFINSYCFFHDCEMVQSFSSIISLVVGLYSLFHFIQCTTNNMMKSIYSSNFPWDTWNSYLRVKDLTHRNDDSFQIIKIWVFFLLLCIVCMW